MELSLEALPAVWSPDSRFIVYSKASGLYYFSLPQLQDNRVLSEDLRRIGDGTIANVRWGAAGASYYISGLIVYAIDPNELFTRALYTGFLKIGRVAGKIPFEFDSNFDSFWVSPDGKNLLLNKGGRNIFLYYITRGRLPRHRRSPLASVPLPSARHDGAQGHLVTREHRDDALRDARTAGARHRGVPPGPGRAGPLRELRADEGHGRARHRPLPRRHATRP